MIPETWEEVTDNGLLAELRAQVVPPEEFVVDEYGVECSTHVLESYPWYQFKHTPRCQWYRVPLIPA